ncbi:c29fd572-d23c-4359-aad2-af1b6d64681d [Sclerotinia trifoliorum]|uniref:C29fd572-d23c-4359-aad2-af1b6d64681d n=1 Tax=Sclerotinia trifoliorum TaxID=28548 RepID=A0A8H2W0D1_9HELO|nr:c29fd572-d23c-4359-aad2-af1b6d64681d [Sclerotinia trifoliorum]
MAMHIESSMQFSKLLGSSTIVISDFYADWCGPCKAIAPTYESLATKHSKPNRVTFTKINVDNQQSIAQRYGVRAMPTFLIFRSGAVIETIQGADVRKLTTAIENAVKLSGAAKPVYSSAGRTLGGSSPTSSSAMARNFSFDRLVHNIIAFFGLYLYSLFSFDAYTAAENSPFNIHKVPTAPAARSTGGRTGATTQAGKKLGTIADIAGKD